HLPTNTLTETATLSSGIGQPYTMTVIGPDGTLYGIQAGRIFAFGNTPQLSVGDVTVDEAAGTATFTVALNVTNTLAVTLTSGPPRRPGPGRGRLHRRLGYAHVRPGRDHQDRHGRRHRRPPQRGQRDLLPEPVRPVQRGDRRRPGPGHDHRRRPRAVAVGQRRL